MGDDEPLNIWNNGYYRSVMHGDLLEAILEKPRTRDEIDRLCIDERLLIDRLHHAVLEAYQNAVVGIAIQLANPLEPIPEVLTQAGVRFHEAIEELRFSLPWQALPADARLQIRRSSDELLIESLRCGWIKPQGVRWTSTGTTTSALARCRYMR